LGSRVVAIDGHPIAHVLRALEAIRGGPPQQRRHYAATYILMPQVLNGLSIAKDDRISAWTVETSAGTTRSQTLAAYAPKHEPYVFQERWYSSELSRQMGPGWQSYKPDAPLPIMLRDFDTAFRRFWLPHSCVMVVQFKANEDTGNQKIADFVADTERELSAHPPCSIIFDNRYNGGGDYTTTASFARRLPSTLQGGGHIYLLTSPATFSAGITITAFIKDAGGDRVKILGETVGDRLAFYAEGGRACLPNIKLCLGYETGKHDYAHSCTDLEKCFWLNWFYPVHVKSLEPDEAIHTSFADWRAARDPVFDRAVTFATRDVRKPVRKRT
jgi:hypothetical protein